MQVLPTNAPLGAEIRDVDLARLTDEEFRELRAALDARAILSIRDQNLTPSEQVEFTARLGPLQPYDRNARFRLPEAPDLVILSNILEDGVAVGAVDAGNSWHTDMPYMERPPAYAALYAVEIPRDAKGEALGATIACSTANAYDTLDDALKERLENLKALHRRDKLQLSPTRLKFPTQFDRDDLASVHPVIRTHPVTGRKCLYVNSTYTVRILGLEEEESETLLAKLCAHATRSDNCYTHKWRDGDLLLWDDCAIQHYALADYALPQRRRIHRGTVDGSQPF